MNKTELIEQVAVELVSTKAEAARAVDAVIDQMVRGIVVIGRLRLPGLGVFEVKGKAAVTRKNPKTGAPVLPAGFKIHVPKIIGNYNPDWGIVRLTPDKHLKLELVRETKGSADPNLLQYSNEKRKITCAEKHFEALEVDYRHIKGDELTWWMKKQD